MLRFKHYTQLQESLNLDQKNALGLNWNTGPSSNAKELSKNMIPEGEDHVRIPITNNTQEKVKDHLEKHGYELSDYNKGEAKDKHGRTVSIGSVLKGKKTEAPEDLVKGFENDDRNSKITPETHNILFSSNPEHVGECSTNKGWKSCAALTPKGRPTPFGKGAAARRLKDSIKSGSHVAYLMKKDEADPEKADARILLHPYHTRDKDGNITHSVLMPERKVYSKTGGKHSDFHTSLEDFARKTNPMQEGKIYRKDDSVYDDDQQQVRFNTSSNSVKKILLGKDASNSDKEDAVKSVKLPPKTISSVLNEPQTDSNYEDLRHAHKLIAKHQKLSDEHFNHLLDNGHVEHLSSNDKLTKGQVKKIANYKQTPSTSGDSELDHIVNKSLGDSLATAHSNIVAKHHDKLGSDDIHSILDTNANREEELKKEGKKVDHAGPISAMANADNLKLKPEHIEKIKKSINPGSKDITGESDDDFDSRTRLGITPEDSKKDIHDKLLKILDQPDSILTRSDKLAALNHKDITPEHISKGLDSTVPSIVHAAVRNKNASPENISKALKHPELSVNFEAAEHKNNNEATINQGLRHKNEMVSEESMRHDKATTGNILNGLKNESNRVKIAAAEHRNNDENTINSALDPKNIDVVKYSAARHYNGTPKNISKALDDKDPHVGILAMKYGDVSPENISKGLTHNDSGVRLAALNHEDATPEHYKMATNDPEASIRVKARNLLNQNKPNSYLNQ